jgi:hypothetical protein
MKSLQEFVNLSRRRCIARTADVSACRALSQSPLLFFKNHYQPCVAFHTNLLMTLKTNIAPNCLALLLIMLASVQQWAA